VEDFEGGRVLVGAVQHPGEFRFRPDGERVYPALEARFRLRELSNVVSHNLSPFVLKRPPIAISMAP
jgi:hypothetical protein